MLLLNLKQNNPYLAMSLIVLSICLTTNVAFSKEENNANLSRSFSNLIESTPKENRYLLDGWNDYLTEVLGYSSAEHLKVIEQLTLDYAKSYKAFNEMYGKDLEQDKTQYSSQWLDDLIAKFGKNFVCSNKRAILLNLMVAFDRKSAKKYDQIANDVLCKEQILYLAYERYLGIFMKYYKQLNEKDQKKMNAWKKVAEKYLSITSKSHFAFIYYGKHMENKVHDNALQKENNELYMYFKNVALPFGSGALSKAWKDMDKLVAMCPGQSLKHPEND
ncbi:MAG: hypothetical protein P8X96_14925 [Desulfobacteraceae bacterium]